MSSELEANGEQRCNCGGDMVGNGYTTVSHCEYADEVDYEFCEPDAHPVHCNFKQQDEQ